MSRFLKALKFWRRHEEKVKEESESTSSSHSHRKKKHHKKHHDDDEDHEQQEQQHENHDDAASSTTNGDDANNANSNANANDTELIGGGPAEGHRSYLDSSDDEKKAAAAAGEDHVSAAPYVEEVIRVRDDEADPTSAPYAFLSPFHHRPTIIAGNEWPTLEHYIQVSLSLVQNRACLISLSLSLSLSIRGLCLFAWMMMMTTEPEVHE